MTETLPWPAQSIAEWLPLWKAAGFFAATFVLEDAAAVGAGLLLAAGSISWPAAFASCFLGIWSGDAGLYALARFAGREWFARSSLRRYSAKVGRSERWFAQRGASLLIFSRVIPGARLPTYLAAGFLRVPLPRFLLVTGVASCVWTIAVLWLAQTFGARLAGRLAAFQHGGWLLFGATVLLFAVLQLVRRVSAKIDFRLFNAYVGRWRHWEFWPAWLFYPPVGLYCLWLAVKYRGLTLPTAANPGIFSGGLIGESKMATLRELMDTSPEFTAEAEWIDGEKPAGRPRDISSLPSSLSRQLEDGTFVEPFILKPDQGQRGVGVKLIRHCGQAEAYLRQTRAPLIAQRYASGPHEVGIFYYRFPHEPRGHIFAITEKIFPKLIGDGRSTVAELIRRDPRARMIAGTYLRRFESRLGDVPASGEELKLVEAGNHAQGCIFRDGMRMWSPELEARIDGISQKLTEFYVGRYDIRYASEADLRAGRNFRIIELNGAASEATSIYDARNSLFAAYRTLFQQWDLVFAIGAANRSRGHTPTPAKRLWRAWRMYCRQAATYPAAD